MAKHKPLQDSDDAHYFSQPGSDTGAPETLIGEDSPNTVLHVNQSAATEKLIEPINKGTRDGQFTEVTDKDKNLNAQFVKPGAIDAESRK